MSPTSLLDVDARLLALLKVEREKKLFARVLCWLLGNGANFWKCFSSMVSVTWEAALGVVRVPNTFGSVAFYGLALASPLRRSGCLSAIICCLDSIIK